MFCQFFIDLGSFVNTVRRQDACCRCPVECTFKDNFNKQFIRDDSTLTSNLEYTSGGASQCNYQLKPKQVCDSDFRRDEYCSHYQNVHWYVLTIYKSKFSKKNNFLVSDIMSSLNGWMEVSQFA